MNEKGAAYRLKALIEDKLPSINLKKEPNEENITFINQDTGLENQIITIAISDCSVQ